MTDVIEGMARAIAGAECIAKQATGLNQKRQLMSMEEYVGIAWPLYAGHAQAALDYLKRPQAIPEGQGPEMTQEQIRAMEKLG